LRERKKLKAPDRKEKGGKKRLYQSNPCEWSLEERGNVNASPPRGEKGSVLLISSPEKD